MTEEVPEKVRLTGTRRYQKKNKLQAYVSDCTAEPQGNAKEQLSSLPMGSEDLTSEEPLLSDQVRDPCPVELCLSPGTRESAVGTIENTSWPILDAPGSYQGDTSPRGSSCA